MKTLNLIVLASTALFASASAPAMALDLGVGGVSVSGGSNGGTSISAGVAVHPPMLPRRRRISRPPARHRWHRRQPRGRQHQRQYLIGVSGTDATVNLGSLGLGSAINDTLNGVTGPLGTTLDGVNAGGLPGGGGSAAGVRLAAAFGGLSPTDQRAIKLQVPRGARQSVGLQRRDARPLPTACRPVARANGNERKKPPRHRRGGVSICVVKIAAAAVRGRDRRRSACWPSAWRWSSGRRRPAPA